MVESPVGGMRLGRSAFQGLVGFVAPALVVFASYPVLLRHLGAAAFGVYLLAVSMSGAMMFLDLGFSAVTLRFVALDLAAGHTGAAADVVLTSLVFYGAAGILGGLGIAALSPLWAGLFKIEPPLLGDAISAFRMAGLPFAACFMDLVFLSVAKAAGRFDRAALYLTLLAIATHGSAAVAVLLGSGLAGAMISVAVAHVAALCFIAASGLRLCRALGIDLRHARPVAVGRMFAFGWVFTLNSAAGFLLFQIQRLLLGAVLGSAAVSVYQVAMAAPAKLQGAVHAASEVLFPLATGSSVNARLRRIYRRAFGLSAVLALVGLGGLVTLGRPLFTWWLGASMAASIAPLLPVFAIAYFVLSLAPAPYHVLNGLGRPGVNTLFSVMNVLLNLALLGIFARSGLTLSRFAWAFALSNVITGICYQAAVEAIVWKQAPALAGAAA